MTVSWSKPKISFPAVEKNTVSTQNVDLYGVYILPEDHDLSTAAPFSFQDDTGSYVTSDSSYTSIRNFIESYTSSGTNERCCGIVKDADTIYSLHARERSGPLFDCLLKRNASGVISTLTVKTAGANENDSMLYNCLVQDDDYLYAAVNGGNDANADIVRISKSTFTVSATKTIAPGSGYEETHIRAMKMIGGHLFFVGYELDTDTSTRKPIIGCIEDAATFTTATLTVDAEVTDVVSSVVTFDFYSLCLFEDQREGFVEIVVGVRLTATSESIYVIWSYEYAEDAGERFRENSARAVDNYTSGSIFYDVETIQTSSNTANIVGAESDFTAPAAHILKLSIGGVSTSSTPTITTSVSDKSFFLDFKINVKIITNSVSSSDVILDIQDSSGTTVSKLWVNASGKLELMTSDGGGTLRSLFVSSAAFSFEDYVYYDIVISRTGGSLSVTSNGSDVSVVKDSTYGDIEFTAGKTIDLYYPAGYYSLRIGDNTTYSVVDLTGSAVASASSVLTESNMLTELAYRESLGDLSVRDIAYDNVNDEIYFSGSYESSSKEYEGIGKMNTILKNASYFLGFTDNESTAPASSYGDMVGMAITLDTDDSVIYGTAKYFTASTKKIYYYNMSFDLDFTNNANTMGVKFSPTSAGWFVDDITVDSESFNLPLTGFAYVDPDIGNTPYALAVFEIGHKDFYRFSDQYATKNVTTYSKIRDGESPSVDRRYYLNPITGVFTQDNDGDYVIATSVAYYQDDSDDFDAYFDSVNIYYDPTQSGSALDNPVGAFVKFAVSTMFANFSWTLDTNYRSGASRVFELGSKLESAQINSTSSDGLTVYYAGSKQVEIKETELLERSGYSIKFRIEARVKDRDESKSYYDDWRVFSVSIKPTESFFLEANTDGEI